MTQQQFYETVMLEEQFVDCWTKEFLQAHANDFYSIEGTIAKLCDMPVPVQRSIVNKEYDKVYHR